MTKEIVMNAIFEFDEISIEEGIEFVKEIKMAAESFAKVKHRKIIDSSAVIDLLELVRK
jgi:hypothetical protein